jgi:hypothetical protein
MSTSGPLGLRPLAALTAVVVAAHLLVLREASLSILPGDAPQVRVAALNTRTVPPAPPMPQAAAAAPAPKPVAPKKPPPVAPRPPRPAAGIPRPSPDTVIASNPVNPSVEGSEVAIDSVADSTPAGTGTESAATSTMESTAAAPASVASAAAASAPLDGLDLNATVPPSARLLYNLIGQARKLDYTARGEVLWRQDGQRYTLRLSVSAFLIGARSQTSEGDITPQGLAPRRYADLWRGEQAAHFNRETQRITFSANTPDVPLLPGAQDRLSLSVQIGALMAANPVRMAPGTRLTLQTANTRAAEPWTFTSDGEEQLDLPFGEVQAFKFSRAPRREYDTRVEVWIAPSLNHAAVRVRVTQGNGDFVDQLLRAIEPVDDPK